MPGLRHKIAPRCVPPVGAARRLGLTLAGFDLVLPQLLDRGFPAADPTTGRYDLVAIDAWLDAQSSLLGRPASAEPAARSAADVAPDRLRQMAEKRPRRRPP